MYVVANIERATGRWRWRSGLRYADTYNASKSPKREVMCSIIHAISGNWQVGVGGVGVGVGLTTPFLFLLWKARLVGVCKWGVSEGAHHFS